ncbi:MULTISPECIES: haloalkane dehalogenase [Rhizobium/Agrobacterium group]|uniref:Haloalkane dehalogenase n=2 Tax=Agrobacterium TaxID=357 RepID=A0A5B9T235_AGRTU|nr:MULTISPECIES: haloalkane dehalogenase [Rhizobium/Agrobacterium group]QEG97836.1 Haloalkane dehalogenase [Agrobacterium tumefaciens]UYZ11346.1 haloalkane dehalogenase [Agrobacterium salinitolerans]WHO25044.1 haloalkane dehalogenase [Agrobacterium tumefaciens]
MTEKSPHPAFGDGAKAYDVPAFGLQIHTVEHGSGAPIVFLHGNPTSSYLWRHIFHRLHGHGRLLAVDLIGYGQSSKPDIEYTLENQQRYVDAWFDALDLRNVTLVLQDYGAAFGLNWASRNPDRVRAVAFFEPVLRNIDSVDLSPEFVTRRAKLLQPGEGEIFVQQENRFLTELFPWFFLTPLAAEDLRQYQTPFPTPHSRKVILAGPRNLPVDGEPASTVAFLEQAVNWLNTSDTPKLLLTFKPGFLLTDAILKWSQVTIRNLEIEAAGAGIHFVQEEQPETIARLLDAWLTRIAGN